VSSSFEICAWAAPLQASMLAKTSSNGQRLNKDTMN